MFEAEMTMTIKNIRREDLGSYICVAKNSLGDVESKIRLYGKFFFSVEVQMKQYTYTSNLLTPIIKFKK